MDLNDNQNAPNGSGEPEREFEPTELLEVLISQGLRALRITEGYTPEGRDYSRRNMEHQSGIIYASVTLMEQYDWEIARLPTLGRNRPPHPFREVMLTRHGETARKIIAAVGKLSGGCVWEIVTI